MGIIALNKALLSKKGTPPIGYVYPTNALYTESEANTMITTQDFIPVASASELDALRNSTTQTMGAGTPWEGNYVTGVDKKYVQVANLDFDGMGLILTIGDETTPFSGNFDGNNLAGENLTINEGLFINSGIIRNIKHSFTGRSYVYVNLPGGLIEACDTIISTAPAYYDNVCGFCAINLTGATIQNCLANGEINQTGGTFVAGFNIVNSGTIQNCNSYVNVSAEAIAAGFTHRIEINASYGNMNGDLINCRSFGSVTSDTIAGGFIGSIEDLTANIQNCEAHGDVVSSGNSVGGFVGIIQLNGMGVINKCLATGNITGVNGVGGFVGNIDSGVEITECKATGDVSGADFVGGFVGVNNRNNPNINNSYAIGTVDGDDRVGGFCGWNRSASNILENDYAIGLVNGITNVGGFCGDNLGTITNSYWNTETSGQATSDGGTGKTTAEMQSGLIDDPDTDGIYVDWDALIWDERTTTEYPILQWENV